MSSSAVITTVAIASAIVLYVLKKMVSHKLRAMTYRNHVASFSTAVLQEQVHVPDAVISDDNSSPSVMQTCCPFRSICIFKLKLIPCWAGWPRFLIMNYSF